MARTDRLHRRKLVREQRDGDHEMERQTWLVIGPRGATQFVCFFHPRGSWLADFASKSPSGMYTMTADGAAFMGVDIGYHSPTPRYGGQEPMGRCDVLKGDCFYDGSSLRATELLEVWAAEFFDEEVLYRYLELEYRDVFEGEDK